MTEKPFHILIIEDSPDDRAEIRRMLLTGSKLWLKLSEAQTGAEGLRAIFEAETPPDCVLLDFSLPDMDAIELLGHLRAGGEMTVCPVVVFTGSDDGGSAVIPAGAQDYLGKNWASSEGLNRAIQNAVERYALGKERLEAADELRVSEEFSRTVLESSPDCVKVLNSDGTLALLNGPGRCLLEIDDPSTVLGKEWWTFWPEESRDLIRSSMAMALKGGSSRFEQFCPTAKGTPKWWDVQVSPVVRADGAIDRIVAVSRDITAQRGAQEAIRETSERLALGLQVSGVALAHVDYLTDVNHLTADTAKLFGMGEKAISVPRGAVHAAFHPEDREELLRRINASLDPGGSGYFVMDHRVCRPDGGVRWLRVHKKVFFETVDGVSRPVRGTLAALDITEQKKAELDLADAARRKDEFLAMLAHELRNPLAPLLTGMEVILKSPARTELVEEVGGMMKRQVDQMAHLIDDLLDVSRIGNGKIELQMADVSLQEVIRQAIEVVEPLVSRMRHELSVEQISPDILVRADHHRLAQIVSNLLSNAAKYTPEGGKIALDVSKHPDGVVRISVKDNGRGIDPYHQARIFELFDQGSSGPKDGLGIGLTLVKSLVEMHGGTVSVVSEGEGKGSEFTVELPVGIVEEARNETVVKEVPVATGKLRVLVADDGKATADILGMFFEMEGMDCKVVYDGRLAVEEAREFQPHLACLDLGMPVLNGYEAASRLREVSPDCHLVALSGWGSEEDRLKTAAAGFHEHLVKPVGPADLRQLIARVDEKRVAAKGN